MLRTRAEGENQQEEKSAAERLEEFYRGKLGELRKMRAQVELMGLHVRDEQLNPA